MNKTHMIDRDERTIAVENAGTTWAYSFMAFALLLDVTYRGWFLNESAWDLLAIVILGGMVQMGYQVRQNATSHLWKKEALIVFGIAGAAAFIIAAALAYFKTVQ